MQATGFKHSFLMICSSDVDPAHQRGLDLTGGALPPSPSRPPGQIKTANHGFHVVRHENPIQDLSLISHKSSLENIVPINKLDQQGCLIFNIFKQCLKALIIKNLWLGRAHLQPPGRNSPSSLSAGRWISWIPKHDSNRRCQLNKNKLFLKGPQDWIWILAEVTRVTVTVTVTNGRTYHTP